MTEDAWQRLRESYPWPKTRPEYDGPIHGWLSKATCKMLLANLPAFGYVVELGSWFGLSALTMLVHRPHVKLVCIDHWRGGRDIPKINRHLVPLSNTGFLHHCWGYRDRIVPVRETTIDGMRMVHDVGLRPLLVYVDAAHDFNNVYWDSTTAWELFPDAVLVGDDWARDTVAAAVQKVAIRFSVPVEYNTNAWRLAPKGKV